MKKLLLLLLALLTFAFIGLYLFIPSTVKFGKIVFLRCNINIATRYIYDDAKWKTWWHSGDSLIKKEEGEYNYKNYRYTVERHTLEGLYISIAHDSGTIHSFLHIVPVNADTIAVEWNGEFPETHDPIKKIRNYLQAVRVKDNISGVLQNVKDFSENESKVYGLDITQQQVKDTILVSTRSYFSTNPSTAQIYEMIRDLKNYISFNRGIETGDPMLNITRDSGFFKTMVAIPVNRVLPQNKKFLLKKMVPGKILVAEVKGGSYTAGEALDKLKLYMDDNHRASPAIPFESLITDRSKEPDTAKWVTKIYFPVY